MKVCLAIVLSICVASLGRGEPFRNLGFDEAITNNVSFLFGGPSPFDGRGPAAELLQYWRVLSGTNLNPVTEVGYNVVSSLAPNQITLIDQQGAFHSGLTLAVEGSYGLVMSSFTLPLTLSQEGQIPADAQFLTYRGSFLFDVRINETPLRRLDLFNLTSHVFNVTEYAGQNVTLSFTAARPNPFFNLAGGGFLDSIAFVIPEPSTWALLLLGGAALLWSARRRFR